MNRKELELLERIAINPKVVVGKPVIRGTGVTVEQVLRMMGGDMTIEEILSEYPHVTRQDILACLCFAEKTISDYTFLPLD